MFERYSAAIIANSFGGDVIDALDMNDVTQLMETMGISAPHRLVLKATFTDWKKSPGAAFEALASAKVAHAQHMAPLQLCDVRLQEGLSAPAQPTQCHEKREDRLMSELLKLGCFSTGFPDVHSVARYLRANGFESLEKLRGLPEDGVRDVLQSAGMSLEQAETVTHMLRKKAAALSLSLLSPPDVALIVCSPAAACCDPAPHVRRRCVPRVPCLNAIPPPSSPTASEETSSTRWI